jgi:hypothetical protein
MTGLVRCHLFEDSAALGILLGKPREMVIEMRFDLGFRFADETQARSISDRTGEHAEARAPYIPKRIEVTRSAAELSEPIGAPSQVVALLGCSVEQLTTRSRRAGKQRLTQVKSLCGDLAGSIHAHERRASRAFFVG